MATWGNGSESGILRKNKPKDNHEDLLVFGYACKLFRDDEKAQYIDQGKHLIPWMADEKLKIDRYDCRGALPDIAHFEASREGFDNMRWLGLSESERKLEQLCDKERYYSLHINEEEEEMYKEEEQKRTKTNEFQYSYDVPAEPKPEEGATVGPELEEEEDEEFVPPPSLDLPVDVTIPKTVKENARIEKTALFVCKQGLQMEILIKAKQAHNPQFGFLNQDHNMYKYYRHVLAAIKNGRYQVVPTQKIDDGKQESSAGGGREDHYLHPSLISANSTTTQYHQKLEVQAAAIPIVPYQPSANCAYSQLVSRIKQGQQPEVAVAPPAPPTEPNKNHMTYEQQQYYQYYYASQYCEYYKQLAQYQQGNAPSGATVAPPDLAALDPSVQNYIQQFAYNQYLQHQSQSQSNNPYAQIVSNVNKDVSNPYTSLLANIQTSQDSIVAKEPPEETRTVIQSPKVDKVETKHVLSTLLLADYGSDDSCGEDDDVTIPEPDGDAKVVIDKMASYVAKNGEQFEEIVKAKGDPRFEFLRDGHDFNCYYRKKLNECRHLEGGVEKKEVKLVVAPPSVVVAKSTAKDTNGSTSDNNNHKDNKKAIAPVSFSIKKPKDEPQKEIKSALPVEESDEDDESKAQAEVTVDENEKIDSDVIDDTKDSTPLKNGLFDGDDPILEMIDLTNDLEERKDAKRAEDKIKDKLAAAARERMARDRALQLERKRKAAAFLKLKSAESEETSKSEVSTVPPKTLTVVNVGSPVRKVTSSALTVGKEVKEVVEVADSGEESDGKRRKTPKKKKSHKRKHSKSKLNSSRSKKSKRKRRRSDSDSSSNSKGS